jgi:hypothetical protein
MASRHARGAEACALEVSPGDDLVGRSGHAYIMAVMRMKYV